MHITTKDAMSNDRLIDSMIADSLSWDTTDRDGLTRHLMLTVTASRIIESGARVQITRMNPDEVQGAECLIVRIIGPRGVEDIQVDSMGDTIMLSGDRAGRTLHGPRQGFTADQAASMAAAFIDGFARSFRH